MDINQTALIVGTKYTSDHATLLAFQKVFNTSIAAIIENTDIAYNRVMSVMLEENASLMNSEDLSTAYCYKGCSVCCSQTVLLTIPEACYLWCNVYEQMPDQVLDLYKSCSKRYLITRNIDLVKLYQILYPCSFLGEQGECQAYSIRPIICRNFYSKTVAICEEPFGLSDDTYEKSILQNPFRIGSSLQLAFQEAWKYLGKIKIVMTIEKAIVFGYESAMKDMSFIEYIERNE